MDDTILEIRNLSKSFGPVQALKNVTLSIRRNEIHAICGENGAGKSTLMKILDGYYPFGSYEGEFLLEGRRCQFQSPRDSIESGIGMIFQEISILRSMSVADNIFAGCYPLKNGLVDRRVLHSRAVEILRLVNLGVHPRTVAGSLNSSQQQLLMIAHALARSPKILILDEPTSALTLAEFNTLMGILCVLKEKGVTSIYISHKLDELSKIANRLTILKDGESVETLEREQFSIERVISGMVGRKLETMYPARQSRIGEDVLRVEGLTVVKERQRDRCHVKDVSFSLRRGEILGLAGLVGAGRSETLNAIYGSLRRRSGSIAVKGKPVRIGSPPAAIRNGIALLTEDRKSNGLFEGCSVRMNITSSIIPRITRWGLLHRRTENTLAEESIRKFRIRTSSGKENVANLSGGNQQKVVLAKALLTDPSIILLDEPTRGIDVGSKHEIYQLMNELVMQGHSILMVSSELPELLNVCDRILVLARSRIVAEFARSEATEEKVIHAAALAGSDSCGD
jgi:ABC-type sugar transport system ATPase subunit